jgi:hypothetical protein
MSFMRKADKRQNFICPAASLLRSPRALIFALLEHPTPDNFARVVKNGYVTKYVFEGPMPMPDGSSPQIRSVWKLIEEGRMMSLVTTYAI